MTWLDRYYGDSIAEALAEYDVTLTAEHMEAIVQSVLTSRENESMASGHDCIPNPLQAEVRRVERLRADDAKDADKRLTAAMEEMAYLIGRLRNRISELERELDRVQRAA